jgi:ABC-type transporter MlaC component
MLGAPCALAAQPSASLRSFVDRLIIDTTTLYASTTTDGAARDRVRHLLARSFDIAGMARAALGPAWDTASAAERRAFRDAFEERIVNAFLRRTRSESKVSMVFVGARPGTHGHQLAATRLIFPERPEQTWIWRLRPAGSSWRVVDLLVDGRSTLTAEREEYARVLAFHRGDLAALIEFVRNRGK